MKRASQERVRQIYTSTPFQYAIGLLITAVRAREARATFVGPRRRRAYAIARTAPGALCAGTSAASAPGARCPGRVRNLGGAGPGPRSLDSWEARRLSHACRHPSG